VWALRDRIDVFWSPSGYIPALLPPNIKTVLTVHDLVWKRFPETMQMVWKRFPKIMRSGGSVKAPSTPISLRIADRLIADSEFTRSEVLELFPESKRKVDVVYLASSLKADGPTAPSPLSTPYFLFVGSYEPRKNLERMLQAYIQYRKLNHSPFDLAIAGSDQWGSFSLSEFIQKNNLQSCVHLFQHQTDSELCALYAHAQALVLVSLYEGFGLPLVEAMQWGLPLIASNTSSVVEIAGNAALLVDPLDTDAITQALNQMTGDPATRAKLADNSRIRGQQFSWEEAASKIMNVIVEDLVKLPKV
jgi:glycosyltransferase involved in cell wall biosynthesis